MKRGVRMYVVYKSNEKRSIVLTIGIFPSLIIASHQPTGEVLGWRSQIFELLRWHQVRRPDPHCSPVVLIE